LLYGAAFTGAPTALGLALLEAGAPLLGVVGTLGGVVGAFLTAGDLARLLQRERALSRIMATAETLHAEVIALR
jgi:hypothetical protein